MALWLLLLLLQRPFSRFLSSLLLHPGIKGREGQKGAQPIITAGFSYHKEAFKLVLMLLGHTGRPSPSLKPSQTDPS